MSNTNNAKITYYEMKSSYVQLDRQIQCMIYEPVEPCEKSQTAVLSIHSDMDYLGLSDWS